jgi:hypothetical protein
MYAKASYRRLGHVDLNGIWHWREACAIPQGYGLELNFSPYPKREEDIDDFPGIGKLDDMHPFLHHPGDDWLAANPVEIPGLPKIVETCLSFSTAGIVSQQSESFLFTLPVELLDHVMSYLDEHGLYAIAGTCRALRYHVQPYFPRRVLEEKEDFSWLWEFFEGKQYPTSPDWPVTWDPCNPPGLARPSLPLGLDTEEIETDIWAQITADFPEVKAVGEAIRSINYSRRENIHKPYRAKVQQSYHEWQSFRSDTGDWIRILPSKDHKDLTNVDWACLWHIFSLPGIRNRMRIWKDCERILDINTSLREDSKLAKQRIVRDVLDDVERGWWEESLKEKGESCRRGLLRRCERGRAQGIPMIGRKRKSTRLASR